MTTTITDRANTPAEVSGPEQQGVVVPEQSFEMPEPQQRGVQFPRED